jgi:hypothetical protein
LLIGSSLPADGWAQHKSAAKRTSPAVINMRSEASGTLSVSLTSAPDGIPLSGTSTQRALNFGTVSYGVGAAAPNVRITRRATGFVVSTRFALDIQAPSQNVTTATVLAAIAAPELHFKFRLDGMPLGTTPQMVVPQVKLGMRTEHLLEIEVPNSVTEKDSQLQNAILIQVIAN